MEAGFNSALVVEGAKLSPRDDVVEIVVGPITMHPALGRKQRAQATLDPKTKTYFVKAPLNYLDYVSADWTIRTSAFGDSVAAGLRKLPKSRFSDTERAALLSVVERATQRTAATRPEIVELAKPVFARLDQDGNPNGLSLQVDGPVPLGSGFLIEPDDAGKYEGFCAQNPKSRATPVKLFLRRSDAALLYVEAWYADGKVVEHWGTCGERGETREHEAPSEEEAARVLARLSKRARTKGYRPIPNSRMKMLIVEYVLDSWGSLEDLDRRHELQESFNALVGWLGLGHLDGGSIGSGSMEISLMVVDYAIAKAAIERATKGTEMAGFNRIYRPGQE
jgi:predicted DNA-binding WGR domain protein